MFGLNHDDEKLLHERLSWSIILSSPFVFVACLILRAPWGKTGTDQWWIRPILPARISWFVFESPNLVWAYICWRLSPKPIDAVNLCLLLLFVLHYLQRAVLYPLLMSPQSKKLPLLMAFSALAYCSVNGYLQAQSICVFHPVPREYTRQPPFLLGAVLFVGGASMNLHSDSILRSLRRSPGAHMPASKPSAHRTAGRHHYRIPHGGMFEYVSAPHFLGEILEWIGFCLLNRGSLASLSLAVFTAANLVPRAVAHHAWYRAHFGVGPRDGSGAEENRYPFQRKAILPFVW